MLAKGGFASRQDARELAEMYHETAKDINSQRPSDEIVDEKLSDPGKVTEHDKFDMTRMGKKQEMRRVFRQFSILSFTCVIMATWEFLLTASSQGMVDGGLSGLFWSYIWTFVGFGLIIASMVRVVEVADSRRPVLIIALTG